jgi:hypothetical protein
MFHVSPKDQIALTEFEIGYIMGLVVGEGSFTGDRKTPCLALKLQLEDHEPLVRLHILLGGRIYGPYNHGGRRYRIWKLRGKDLIKALPLFRKYLPASRKRTQFECWEVRYGLILR